MLRANCATVKNFETSRASRGATAGIAEVMSTRSLRGMLVMAALAAALPAIGVAQVRQQRVAFKPGASSASISGTLTGDDTIDYVLGARAGQTMTIAFKPAGPNSSYNVLPPGSEVAIAIGDTVGNQWSGTLPANGDYRMRVFLSRAAARGKTESYALTVSIKGAVRSIDARVPGTPFHATGKVGCSVGPDAPGSALCSLGVIRRGAGQAEVHLADVGFDVSLHKDHLRVLRFAGSTVTSADAKARVTATKKGDMWTVTVNDFYHYQIPDAVIVGG